MKSFIKKEDYLLLDRQPLAGTTFVNWIRVLIDNKFQIDLQFLPRALYVSLIIIFVTPLRLIEKRKFEKKLKDIKLKDPIFIIGHWRSGTTFLHYLMGIDKNLAYVSTMQTLDPSIFLYYEKLLKKIVKKSLPKKRPMDNLDMNTNLPYEEEYAIANLSPYSFYHAWYFPRNIEKYLKRDILFENDKKAINEWKKIYIDFLKKITYKNNGKQVILKSLVNTAKIKFLLEMFPNAKFIHIYRNPYKVYMSTWRLYKSILPLFSFQHIDKKEFDKSILNVYKKIYKKFISEKNLIPKENLIEIKYEDFIKEPLRVLDNIYNKFNLDDFNKTKPKFKKFIDKHKNYKKNNYRLDNKIKNKVYTDWNFAFKEFNYLK